MKEVEFTNSRVEQVSSQQQQQQQHRANDCPPKTKNTGASDATKEPLRFTREERQAIIAVLRNFTDILAIYRSTLDNHALTRNSKESDIHFDRNEMIIKFQEDSMYVSNLLEDLIKDVEINGRYDVLVREIENNRKRHDEEIAIIRDYEETIKNLGELQKLLEEETKANSREREKLRANLVVAKNETRRLQYKVNIELRYVKAREEARREANSLRCSIDLKSLEDTLKNLSSREKNEHRVATDIVNFLEENMRANERATSEWQKRYEREMLMYESGNERLSKEIENKREALEKLQLEYHERQEFIDTYMAEKKAAKELKKREEHRRDCAIRIQAWWRGVMVRRKLGPYRPDERKKKRAVKSKK